jgi:diaminopimelate epimerase
MKPLRFWKVQSIGNDFPLIHIDDFLPLIEGRSLDFELSRLAAAICDRRFGVGGDGLLTVQKEEGAVRLRMFNPDGTEDFCGNGIRCAVVHVHEQGWTGEEFTIRHLKRDVPVKIAKGHVFTTIGEATYEPEKVPVKAGELFNTTVWSGIDGGTPLSLFGSVLSTGTTHTIIHTTSIPDDDTFRSVSAKIEVDPKFPDRTSVIWTQELEPNVLKIRIWERGVGETLACGTGSSAAAADYLRRKGRGGTVEVRNPGGSVLVRLPHWYSPIEIEGVATEVYSGTYFWEGAPEAKLPIGP